MQSKSRDEHKHNMPAKRTSVQNM